VAVARGYKKDEVDWFSCALFGDRAEKLAPYMLKGTKVLCEGSVQINSYMKDGEKKYSTEIFINNIEFIGKKEEHAEIKGATQLYNDSSPFENETERPF
jgi:single-strand DNA-binding protein